MKIAVIGAGSFGMTLAQVLTDNNIEVNIWDMSEEKCREINTFHTNSYYFNDKVFSESIVAYNDLKKCIDECYYILTVIPSAYIRETLKKINKVLNKKQVFINAAKGIEPETFKTISDVIKEEIDEIYLDDLAILSGPTHAESVNLRMLSTIVCASKNIKTANEIQKIFANEYFRVYTNTDVLGIEVASSIKNVIAIAVGCLEGLQIGDNARAALITRGLAEMVRYGEFVGCEKSTFYGLAGLGDLIVTSTSLNSRNFRFGMLIASGMKMDDAIKEIGQSVEGVRTAKALYEFSKINNIELPICEIVYEVCFNNLNPEKAISYLMSRNLKSEI